jgi:hypothetical protein
MTRGQWRAVFLGSTAAVVAMELWAANNGNPDTEAWTTLACDHLPKELVWFLVAGTAGWLPVHFWMAYQRRQTKDAP